MQVSVSKKEQIYPDVYVCIEYMLPFQFMSPFPVFAHKN